MTPRKRPEQTFHRQVAEFLSVALGGAAWWTTFPAGGGGVVRGKILASLGLKPGVPDIMILDGRRTVFLELKAKYRKASPEQVECHKAIHRAGGVVHIVKSLDEVIIALRCAGVPLRIARGEAASTEEQKYSDENRCSATSIGSLAPSVDGL